jgi:type IV fimbrial biogenesis protein FimT
MYRSNLGARVQGLRPASRAAGYTLVELLAVIVIIAVVAAIAFPSFQAMANGNRLTSGTNEVVATLQMARLEAIRRNTRVVVCSSTDGTSCNGAGNWSRMIAFVDTDRDGVPDVGEQVVRDTTVPGPAVVNASAAVTSNKISFRPDGVARAGTSTTILNGRLGVCIVTTKPPLNARNVAVAGSRISVAAPLTSASCAAPT